MILYIAGPMTGYPEHNYPAFHEAEKILREWGYDILNPARHPIDGRSWSDCMRRDLPDLAVADGIATLRGWEHSRGAQLEAHIATELGLPVKYVVGWILATVLIDQEGEAP